MAYPHELIDEFDVAEGHSQDGVMAGIAIKAIARRRSNATGNSGGKAGGDNELHVYLAMWSQMTGRAEGWALSSAPGWFGDGYNAFVWTAVDQIHTPPTCPIDRDGSGLIATGGGC